MESWWNRAHTTNCWRAAASTHISTKSNSAKSWRQAQGEAGAKCTSAPGLQKLTRAFPQRPRCGLRIVHDLRRCIEAHSRHAVEFVSRPTAVSIGGEADPGGVHGVGELLWRIGSQKRLGPGAERVEDEGNLKRMAGAEKSVVLRRADRRRRRWDAPRGRRPVSLRPGVRRPRRLQPEPRR